MNSIDKLKELKTTFDTHPGVGVLYGTSDGQTFFKSGDANNHARKLADSTITPYSKSQVEKLVNDADALAADADNEVENAKKAEEAENARIAAELEASAKKTEEEVGADNEEKEGAATGEENTKAGELAGEGEASLEDAEKAETGNKGKGNKGK